MINNFKLLEPLLTFNEPGDFYFLQLIQRKKDNPHIERNLNVIDNHFIYDLEKFRHLEDSIIHNCIAHNARAYLRLNVRNAEKIALRTLQKTVDLIVSKDYKAVKNAYLSAAGESNSQKDKRWLVDIDEKLSTSVMQQNIDLINSMQPVGDKILKIVPTKNGYHIICNPFNLQEWRKMIPFPLDIHKDNPTCLYVP